MSPENLLQLIWVSSAVRPWTETELLQLLAKSRASNAERGITGILLYHRSSFFQLMEGPAEAVLDVFTNRIQTDRRHAEVALLLRREVAQRAFPDFSMGFLDVERRVTAELPGFRDYRHTTAGFLRLRDDNNQLGEIINGFHEGRWHSTL